MLEQQYSHVKANIYMFVLVDICCTFLWVLCGAVGVGVVAIYRVWVIGYWVVYILF